MFSATEFRKGRMLRTLLNISELVKEFIVEGCIRLDEAASFGYA